jgi:proliferating cell nuclear antigen
MTFTATITDSLFRSIIDFLAVKDFLLQVNILCTPDGIRIQSMDSSHVALVDFKISRNFASVYICDSEVTLGVNLEAFNKILKSQPVGCDTRLTFNEKKNVLVIQYYSREVRKCASKFELKLVEIHDELLETSSHVDYENVTRINLVEFGKTICNLASFGQDLEIEKSSDTIIYKTKGDITEASCFSDVQDWNIEPTMIAFKYLLWFIKISTIDPHMYLCIDENKPILFSSMTNRDVQVSLFVSAKTVA